MRLKKPAFTDKRKKPIVKKTIQPKLKIPKLMSAGIRTGLGGSFNPSPDSTMDTSSPSSDNDSGQSSDQGSSGEASYKKGGLVGRGQGISIKIKKTKIL
jgi:hypothetical protein